MKQVMKRTLTTIALALSFVSVAAVEDKQVVEEVKITRTSQTLWAYQPVTAPAQPTVTQKQWVRTPIDAYVLAQLEAKGIKPSPDADRATFIRRATLDVWGVIPTPEEVHAFVNDRSANAYEKLADRLLASPRYGERQARRWLDLARYADSSGFTNDETRANMWRYRDYVINSFNQDVPFDRFAREQLAGDELWPDSQQALIATGFLRGYPDDSNSRDLVQKKYQNTTDMTDTVGTVFLAHSIGCARCHNHKSDKVSQKEYFQLQAFFANTNATDKVPVVQKTVVETQYEKDLAKWEEASQKARDDLKAFAGPYLAKAETYNKERFLPDTRVSLFKPESEWNAHDRWINQRYENTLYEELGKIGLVSGYLKDLSEKATADKATGEKTANAEEKQEDYKALYAQYKKLEAVVKKFDKLKPVRGSVAISAVTELGHADAPPTHVLFGGIHDKPLEEVQPVFPVLFNRSGAKTEIHPTATSSGRRSALANWIASAENPLTARVFVNRVWDSYFGRGIVATVSDFGRAGQKPTHPELLNYLADNFVKQGWSVKKLQREILLSSVYRQSSQYRQDAFKTDPDNKLLAVFPRKRLEAEQIRDSLLVAASQLEEKVGGPSVYAPIPAAVVEATGRPDLWKVSEDSRDHNRRSLYVFTRRSVPYPMFETFDMASAQTVHSRRDVTTTPLQALTLVNNDVVYKWSQALAGRVIREAGSREAAQLDRLFQILYARAPDKFEKDTLLSYLGKHENVLKQQLATGKLAVVIPTGLESAQTAQADPLRLAALVDLTHTLVNSNEFTYRY